MSEIEFSTKRLPEKEDSVFFFWNTERYGNGYCLDYYTSLYDISTNNIGKIALYAQWISAVQYSNPFLLQVPVEYATNALSTIKDPTILNCYRNFCELTTYNKDFAQSLISKGIASENITDPDSSDGTTGAGKAYLLKISGEHVTDALLLGGADISLSCYGTSPKFVSCQLWTANESTAKSLVKKGMAKSYIEDYLIPIN